MSEKTTAEINPSNVKAKAPKEKKQRSGSGFLGWFNFLLILILAGVIAAGGWFGWRHHNILVAQLNFFKQAYQEQTNKEGQLTQGQRTLETSLAEQRKETLTLKDQTTYALDQLAKMAGADRQDWLVAEAEYLLRLANQRLNLERDWGSALAMLQAADQVLIEADNPRLAVVRSHISKEMYALRQAPKVDAQGAIYRLQSLQEAIPTLPWVPEKTIAEESSPAESQPTKHNATWYGKFWDKFTESLSKLVRIRERSGSEVPLNYTQQLYLQQNMHLMLEQVQLALLSENQELYQQSLERVNSWLDKHIENKSNASKIFQESIQELAQWNVAPERPDISASLLSLRKLIEQDRRGAIVGGE